MARRSWAERPSLTARERIRPDDQGLVSRELIHRAVRPGLVSPLADRGRPAGLLRGPADDRRPDRGGSGMGAIPDLVSQGLDRQAVDLIDELSNYRFESFHQGPRLFELTADGEVFEV